MTGQQPAENRSGLFDSARAFVGFIRRYLIWILLVFVVGLFVYLVTHMAALSDDKGTGYDTPSKNPVPRWVSIRSSKVFARLGPSADHPVKWVYKQKGLPVQVISETRDWRLVCDPEGKTAWVRHDMVSSRRFIMTRTGQDTWLMDNPKPDARQKARLRPLVIATLDRCKNEWCRIEAEIGKAGSGKGGKLSGWVQKSLVWGVQDRPACQRPS